MPKKRFINIMSLVETRLHFYKSSCCLVCSFQKEYARLSSGNLCGWIAECFLTKLCINGGVWWYVVVWAEYTYFYSIFLEFVPVSCWGAWMVVCSAYWSARTIFKASLAWVRFLSWLQTQKSLTSWSLRVCFLITYFFLDKLIHNFTQYYAGDWRRPWGFIKCQHAFTCTMSW